LLVIFGTRKEGKILKAEGRTAFPERELAQLPAGAPDPDGCGFS
jgi:hypothetical protein